MCRWFSFPVLKTYRVAFFTSLQQQSPEHNIFGNFSWISIYCQNLVSGRISGKSNPVCGRILNIKKADYPAGYPVHPYSRLLDFGL
jgi:hypothetical protein